MAAQERAMHTIAKNGEVGIRENLLAHEVYFGDFSFCVSENRGGTAIIVADTPAFTPANVLRSILSSKAPPYMFTNARFAPRGLRLQRLCETAAEAEAFVRSLAAAPDYWYHGTTDGGAASIATEGLSPRAGSETSWGDSDLDDWSRGKVFLTSSADNALSYAEQKAAAAAMTPVLLRIDGSVVNDFRHDPMGLDDGEVYVTHAIHADAIEMFVDNAWRPLEVIRAVHGAKSALAVA